MTLMPLLRDRKFLIRTDHENLKFLHDSSNSMIIRWDMALQELDKMLLWFPGDSNVISDTFSRLCSNLIEAPELPNTINVILGSFTIPQNEYKMISQVHNSVAGHKGVDDTVRKLLKANLRFPYMRAKVKKFLKECPVCQKMSASKVTNNAAPFTSSSYSIMESLNIDFIGPFPDKGYVLTIIDKFSRWVELYATDDATARSAAECLLNHFGRYGSPKLL